MATHPNVDRWNAHWELARQGDCSQGLDDMADDVILENGPGAGPWRRAIGKDDLALLMVEFFDALGGTFHQDGRCVYADDRVSINLVHETGKASGGDPFDNMAVWIARLRPDGGVERIWTVDLGAEHCEEFWRKNPGTPSKDFS